MLPTALHCWGRQTSFKAGLGIILGKHQKVVSLIIILFVNVGIKLGGSAESLVPDNCHFGSLCLIVHPGIIILGGRNIIF